MNNDIVILREAIKKIIPMLAGKGLIVTQMGTQAYVKPHPVTGLPHQVNIPLLPDNAEPEFVVAIQGFIDHEVAHVLYTDFLFKAREKSKRLHSLHNIVEDTMIERLMGQDFPGSKRNISRLRDYFLENVTKVALAKATNAQEEFNYLIVVLARALAGHVEFQRFMDDNNYWEQEKVKEFMLRFPKNLQAKMPLLETTEETYEMALEIEAILYPPPPPVPPQPEPEEEKDEDDSQGEGSDDQQKSEGEDDKDHSDEEQTGDGEGQGEREHTEDNDKASGGEGEKEDDEETRDGDDSAGDGADDGDDDQTGEEDAGQSDDGDGSEDEDDKEGAADEDEGDAGADQPDNGGSEAEDSDAEDQGEPSEMEDGANEEGGDDQDGDSESDGSTEGSNPPGDADEEQDGDDDEDGDDQDASTPPLSNVAIEQDDDQLDQENAEATEEDNDLQASGIGYDPKQNPFEEMDDDALEEQDLSSALVKIIVKEAIAACKASEYSIFTRDYDTIKTLDVPADFDSKYIVQLEEETRSLTGVMQKDIERMMAAQARVFNVAGQRSGRLNSAGLHRLTAGDARVFSRREEIRTKDTAVALLSDCSGSMKGAPMATAVSASYALASVLERCNIPAECMGFTTANLWGGPSVMTRARIDQFNEDLQAEYARSGINFNRVHPIYMPIFKEFHERLNADVKKRFAYQRKFQPHMGGNIDGESLEYAAMRLARRKENRKVIIVLSDGFPAGATNDDAHLKYMVQRLTNMGFDLVGIGIKSAAVERFYDNYVILNSVEELPKAVMGELKKILMK
ncbi:MULTISPECIES: hypothetical protein [unclassified Ensifer]|uniref:cobaltochelatase CobT-related protein n=1 Tax=unclassified Ensifer TaxID=2633371 RepID=UPI000813A80C|nr:MULTISPECIES: hypothetical protein [unclassified Ensifer]OCP22019.1 hypothetical protein BC361_25985 [Ensifer sp. LC54]OCP23201.1 hypothetical protein BC363_24780 [Ensifer sp. LC384]